MSRPQVLGVIAMVLVLAAAAVLRLGAVNGSVVVEPLRADAREYFLYAYNLRLHGVYSNSDSDFGGTDSPVTPTATRSPGYPLFLALFVDGAPDAHMLRAVLIVQAALGVATVLLAWLVFRRWIPNPAAVGVALLCALSPHLVNSGLYLLTETLFTLTLLLVLWAVGGRWADEGRLDGVTIGLLIGVANLVRPSLMLFGALLALLLLVWLGRRRGARPAALIVVGFLLVQAPWTLRNLVSVERGDAPSVLLATATAGMYPNFMYEDQPATYGYAYRFDPDAELYKRDAGALTSEVLRRFRTEPAKHLRWFLLVKPITLWSWDIVQGQGGAFVYELSASPYYKPGPFAWSYRLMHWLHWPLVAMGALGAVLAWLPSARHIVSPGALRGLRITSALLAYFVVLHMLLAPYPRYSVPLRPPLYGMAAFAAWAAWARVVAHIGFTRPSHNRAKHPSRS